MNARSGFVFSCSASGAHSNRFQVARQANNSYPLIRRTRKDCEPNAKHIGSEQTCSGKRWLPANRKGGSP
jgi:hypothetical protein